MTCKCIINLLIPVYLEYARTELHFYMQSEAMQSPGWTSTQLQNGLRVHQAFGTYKIRNKKPRADLFD